MRSWSLLRTIGRAFPYGVLTALPLCGLVLFFEMTQPASVMSGNFVSMHLSNIASNDAGKAQVLFGHRIVAHFKGVSAEVHSQSGALGAKSLGGGNSFQVADNASAGFKPGTEAEYVTRDRHRVALRIVSRQSLVDRSVPDNATIMDVAPASTAKLVTFVWGDWLYTAEINDKGVEPEVVVQKIL